MSLYFLFCVFGTFLSSFRSSTITCSSTLLLAGTSLTYQSGGGTIAMGTVSGGGSTSLAVINANSVYTASSNGIIVTSLSLTQVSLAASTNSAVSVNGNCAMVGSALLITNGAGSIS